MTRPFHIDEDIRQARTLPSHVYFDPAVHRRASERIFARSWQPVGNVARLEAPGHVIPFTLLDGSVDEALVLTRDDEGCPAPEDNLPSLPLNEWGPFFFSSLDPMCDFEAWIRPVRERVDWLRPERFVLDESHSSDYLISASWTLYCDNYLEGFHVPYVHAASLGDKLDYGEYHTELFEWSNVQIGIAKEGEPTFHLPDGHPDEGKRIAAWYFWLFPNIMLNFYLWGVSVNIVQTPGPARTRVLFRSYVSDLWKVGEGPGSELHRVEMEDEEIVESAQQGGTSRLYDRGRYSPRREKGPHHFRRLLARALPSARSEP